jgi:hypothetical protein
MGYRFATDRKNYEDFASGRVLYSEPGTTSFPVRLAEELYGQGRQLLIGLGNNPPYRLYDPCCGGGYMLTVLGLLHGTDFAAIAASDAADSAVALARRNLALLSAEGLEQRKRQLRELYAAHGKASHRDAEESAGRLASLLHPAHPIATAAFRHDITTAPPPAAIGPIDLVIADLPYGSLVSWQSADAIGRISSGNSASPVPGNPPPGTGADFAEINHAAELLEHLLPCLAESAVVIIVSDKKQQVAHPAFRRLKQEKLGKRKIVFLQPASLPKEEN